MYSHLSILRLVKIAIFACRFVIIDTISVKDNQIIISGSKIIDTYEAMLLKISVIDFKIRYFIDLFMSFCDRSSNVQRKSKKQKSLL